MTEAPFRAMDEFDVFMVSFYLNYVFSIDFGGYVLCNFFYLVWWSIQEIGVPFEMWIL